MDLTCLIPCEILQLIASCLLPRYQCRFALTSRRNYDYLYSPLLRWHAQKAAITPPIYNQIPRSNRNDESIIRIKDKVVIYRNAFVWANYYTLKLNLTNKTSILIDYKLSTKEVTHYYLRDYNMLSLTHAYKDLLIASKYYKYVHRDHLLALVNLSQRIYKIPVEIRIRIRDLADIHSLYPCGYLNRIFYP